ncbi:DNA adenine methylase [Mycobacteroides abscessus]|uniref:D12 class N6 adenine-specific DNA methyltransferase n=1 Tax=Mycobacteroides abscessus TaxID=36809 RepID=A0A0U0ZQI2_9MYCO|nr:DNA adenine methylase [Mycobacteroides abscessus]MDB2213586.1 DNA adenine methylase [Mycobacteroides abscessus subsp. massiliense]MDM2102895.1 DNA adenine methylase [Mycobacteroides abscessus]MDM2132943.1 DNA adenine methylase [Mycobacteroides abscessus]MDM2143137.1 DNA adenine methylase [Mycobacteroides abscessus]MDM2152132.1 DNA adenine methylase [Mycobacteroides abscessus]
MTPPPMAYFGGKTRLARRIADLLPQHGHYIEPFAGGLSVLLAKKPSRMETVNDLDGQLMTFWRVLRDKPEQLARACALTPHSRAEYSTARDADLDTIEDDVERARLVWVQIAEGRGGTLLRQTGWRYYVNPSRNSTGMPGYLSAYVDRMAAAAERLHHVSLESRPALEIIEKYGAHPKCCLYVDPPYLATTRSAPGGGNGYRVDMPTHAEHVELLWVLMGCQASVVLSGYPSELYDTALAGWDRIEIPHMTGQGNGANQGRTEVIWSNRPLLQQMTIGYHEADE